GQQGLAQAPCTGRCRRQHPTLDRDTCKEQRRSEQGNRCERKHRAWISRRDQDPGSERTDESRESLDRRSGAVGGDQLLRCSRERRQERLQRWSKERRGEPEQAREREDDVLVPIEGVDRCRAGEREATARADRDEETLAPESIAHECGERCDE